MNRWEHQDREIAAHALDPARALFWSPRTGKTRTTVKCMEQQADANAKHFVVIAPQFVCRSVWAEEIFSSGRFGIIDLSHGKVEDRIAKLREARQARWEHRLVVLVNWEALAKLADEIIKFKPDCVIADEAHFAKSASAARSRALHRLGKVARFRRILTGTPTPRDYIDLYSQFKFLAPGIFGTNKNTFIERYVELDYFKRPKYYKNLPELRAKMLAVTSYFDRAKEWKDLPPQELRRTVAFPVAMRKIYDDLVKTTVAELGDGTSLSLPHKLSRLSKLMQLSAGFLYDENGAAHWMHNAKVDAVIEEVRDILAAGQKAVVFYHFGPEGREIERRMRTEYGAICGRIGGDTPLGMRESLRKSFVATGAGSLQVMLMQDSLGVGISLRSAPYLIRTTYPLDYKDYAQSNERIYDDPDTVRTFISVEIPNSVDAFAKRICTRKEQASTALWTPGGFEDAAYGRLNLETAA